MENKWIQLIVAKDALGKTYLCKAPFDTAKPGDEVVIDCGDGLGSVRVKAVMACNYIDPDKAKEVIRAAFGCIRPVPAVQQKYDAFMVEFRGDEMDV